MSFAITNPLHYDSQRRNVTKNKYHSKVTQFIYFIFKIEMRYCLENGRNKTELTNNICHVAAKQ